MNVQVIFSSAYKYGCTKASIKIMGKCCITNVDREREREYSEISYYTLFFYYLPSSFVNTTLGLADC